MSGGFRRSRFTNVNADQQNSSAILKVEAEWAMPPPGGQLDVGVRQDSQKESSLEGKRGESCPPAVRGLFSRIETASLREAVFIVESKNLYHLNQARLFERAEDRPG